MYLTTLYPILLQAATEVSFLSSQIWEKAPIVGILLYVLISYDRKLSGIQEALKQLTVQIEKLVTLASKGGNVQ